MAPTLPPDDLRPDEGVPIGSKGNTPMPATAARAFDASPTAPTVPTDLVSAARRRSVNVSQRPAAPDDPAGACPVAALAAEAAGIRRLMMRLHENSPHADQALIEKLHASDDQVSITELRDLCFARLEAIVALATHRRTKSVKGALFQIYAAVDRVTGLDEVLPLSIITGGDRDRFENWREEVRRLAYSAASHLEMVAKDDDLRLLREWMLAPAYDVAAEFDRLSLTALKTSTKDSSDRS